MEGRKELGEHPDSPMRKRPRIDGGAEEECRTPDSKMLAGNSDDTIPDTNGNVTSANDHDDLPSPVTPSKVTLNLRTPDTSPMLLQSRQDPTSDTIVADDGNAGARASTPTPEYVVIDDNSQSDSAEAVDIELDDSEDNNANSTNGAGPLDETSMIDLCNKLLDCFPPHNVRRHSTHVEKAAHWVTEAGKGTCHGYAYVTIRLRRPRCCEPSCAYECLRLDPHGMACELARYPTSHIFFLCAGESLLG